MATTKVHSEQLVPLLDVYGVVGGTIEGVREWARQAGASVVEMWDGREAVTVADAKEIRRLVEEYRERNHAVAAGYERYHKEREAEKQRIRREVYEREHNRLLVEQRQNMRAESGKNGRPFLCAGSEFNIGLDPRAQGLANRIANEQVEEWERKNRELSQDEWVQREEKAGRL